MRLTLYKAALKFMAIVRLFITDPLVSFFVYIFSTRKLIKSLRKSLKAKYGNFPEISTEEMKSIMAIKTWSPEKWGGIIDFTYKDPYMFLSDLIATKWGRDCDDFAEQWYQHFKFRKEPSVKMILLMDHTKGLIDNLKSLHFIVVIKHYSGLYSIADNQFLTRTLPSYVKSLPEVMKYYETFCSRRAENSIIWTVYKTFRT